MILAGDCLEVMRGMGENSVDSIVTDCPYGYAFMGKKWDYEVPSVEMWREALRVLKPGGHLLCFGGTRTYHRIAVNIEDAGFEIRDQLQWIYGSGFPKSLDVSKAIDKAAGAEREVVGSRPLTGGGKTMKGGRMHAGSARDFEVKQTVYEITAPSTDAAKQWQGWGTALKPANEPIVLARKPLSEPTVAANVLKWSVGAINIDATRIAHNEPCKMMKAQTDDDVMTGGGKYGQAGRRQDVLELKPNGRFPSNLLLSCLCSEDGQHDLECPVHLLDAQSGIREGGHNPIKGTVKSQFNGGHYRGDNFRDKPGGASRFFYKANRGIEDDLSTLPQADSAGEEIRQGVAGQSDEAAHPGLFGEKHREVGKQPGLLRHDLQMGEATKALRFIYCPKASKRERNEGLEGMPEKRRTDAEGTLMQDLRMDKPTQRLPNANHHPTVKPITLMRYLCRLVTPPGGIVLDPFAGSGSTGVAALKEGFRFIGIEREDEYVEIANRRISSLIP